MQIKKNLVAVVLLSFLLQFFSFSAVLAQDSPADNSTTNSQQETTRNNKKQQETTRNNKKQQETTRNNKKQQETTAARTYFANRSNF